MVYQVSGNIVSPLWLVAWVGAHGKDYTEGLNGIISSIY